MAKLTLGLIGLLLFGGVGHGWASVIVIFHEPATNDCSQFEGEACPEELMDYSHTRIVVSYHGTVIEEVDIPATSPRGGGEVRHKVIFPEHFPDGAILAVCAWGFDLSGQTNDIPTCYDLEVSRHVEMPKTFGGTFEFDWNNGEPVIRLTPDAY